MSKKDQNLPVVETTPQQRYQSDRQVMIRSLRRLVQNGLAAREALQHELQKGWYVSFVLDSAENRVLNSEMGGWAANVLQKAQEHPLLTVLSCEVEKLHQDLLGQSFRCASTSPLHNAMQQIRGEAAARLYREFHEYCDVLFPAPEGCQDEPVPSSVLEQGNKE